MTDTWVFYNCSNLQIRFSLRKVLILLLWIFSRIFDINYCGYDIIFRFPRESFVYITYSNRCCNVAKLNRLHYMFTCIIFKIPGDKSLLNKIFVIIILIVVTKILPLTLNSEVAILFIRFATEHSFQQNSSSLPVTKNSRSGENNSRFLWQISEIEIFLKIFRCNAFLPEKFSGKEMIIPGGLEFKQLQWRSVK